MTERRLLRFAAAALLACVAAWAGMRIRSAWTASAAHARSVRGPVGEASAPTATDLAADLDAGRLPTVRIPERLPEFSLAGRDGKATPISAWQGKSLIINFWATWCAPCRDEIPLLQALSSEWAEQGVVVVGIAVDQPSAVLAFADRFKITYPILVGDQDALDVATAFGVGSPVFPFTVFTDRRGEVVALYVGELHEAQAKLILSVVQNLDHDRVALAQARRTISEGLHALGTTRPG